MKRMLMISLYPFLVLGMNQGHSKKTRLERTLEAIKTIDPEAADEEYYRILKWMKTKHISLTSALERIMQERNMDNKAAIMEGWGFTASDMESIRGRVANSLASKTKKTELNFEAVGLLSKDLESYIKELFEKKGCRGTLTIRNEPEGDSLIQLKNDAYARVCPDTCKIKRYHYTGHTLVFNDQFLSLDLSLQKAFVHLFTSKIATGDALWSALFTEVLKAKKSPRDAQKCADSPLGQACREHMILRSLCNTVADDPEHAACLVKIYELYADQHTTNNNFAATYPACRDWAKRLWRFVNCQQAMEQEKKD